jgi:predicted esterase
VAVVLVATGLAGALLAGSLLTGCARDYAPLPSGEVRAFHVPIGDAAGAADSTLCLFSVPTGYDPARSWPLVVTLHGYGSDAPRFHDLWRTVAAEEGFVLATPQGEERTAEGIGWAWGAASDETIRRCVSGVSGAVNVDPARIHVVGFSQGAKVACRLGMRHPHVFAGIAALGCDFRAVDLSAAPAALGGLRVYVGRGEREPHPDAARDAAATLRERGCAVELRVYPGVGHGLPAAREEELRRVLAFLAGPA